MKFINQLKPNDRIDSYMYLRYISKEKKAKNKKPYYRILLQDKTGQIWGNYFPKEGEHDLSESIKGGIYVNVRGLVGEYNGNLNANISSVEKVGSEVKFNRADLFPFDEKVYDDILSDGIDIRVVGVSHYKLGEVLSRLEQDAPLSYTRETDNPYDSNAIAISFMCYGENYQIGHIPADKAATIAPMLDEDCELEFVYKRSLRKEDKDNCGILITVREKDE